MSLQVLYPTLSDYDIRYYVMEILKVGHPDVSRLASFSLSSRCWFEPFRHYRMCWRCSTWAAGAKALVVRVSALFRGQCLPERTCLPGCACLGPPPNRAGLAVATPKGIMHRCSALSCRLLKSPPV